MGRHGATNADPLLLAAGERGRIGILLVGETNVLEDAERCGTGLGFWLLPDGDQPFGDVV